MRNTVTAWVGRHQSIFVQLMVGVTVVLAVLAALWLGASRYFLREMDKANARRWMAGAVANQLFQLRIQERDFILDEADDSSFIATGDAPSIQDHAAGLSLVKTWIDSLAKLSDGDLRTAATQLQQNVDTYGATFRDIVTTMHARRATKAERDDQQAKLSSAVADIDPVLNRIIVASVRDSEAARRRLVGAAPVILVLGLAVAMAFIYRVATGVSRATTDLERAASDIGNGQFTTRVTVRSRNELGRLGASFNRMADNLAALVGAVTHSGAQINASSSEIAATARQQQATASQIAVTTSEVGATAKSISTTSRELAGIVQQVAGVAEQTASLAESGQTGLTRMEETMRRIAEASGAVNARLAVLSEKAGNINSVVTTIVKVADQTNLLSLNAAIEAEKAGEYGRGFAVVATEIRRLADQTAAATGDIEQIVKEMQSAVTAGVMGMDKFSDEVRRGVEASDQVNGQLSEIIRQIQALTPNIEIVNDGMQSQAEGAQQISEALAQLSESVQQTAESLTQSNRAIDQLNDVSQQLQVGVSRFAVHT